MAGRVRQGQRGGAAVPGHLRQGQLLPRDSGPGAGAGEEDSARDLFRLEQELEIPLVATNDSHYLCGEDSHAHDVMLCVQTGAKIHDANRFKFDSRPVLCEERRRDGAAVSRIRRACCSGPWRLPSAATSSCTRWTIRFRSLRCRRGTPSTATLRRCAARGCKKRMETAVRQLELRGELRRATPMSTRRG